MRFQRFDYISHAVFDHLGHAAFDHFGHAVIVDRLVQVAFDIAQLNPFLTLSAAKLGSVGRGSGGAWGGGTRPLPRAPFLALGTHVRVRVRVRVRVGGLAPPDVEGGPPEFRRLLQHRTPLPRRM